MILLSCRKDETSTVFHKKQMDLSPLCPIREGDRVLVLIHGYRADYGRTITAYKTIEDRLHNLHPGQYQHVIGFLWPGSWSATFGFMAARTRTDESAKFLAEALFRLASKGAVVTVQGHSLGCQVMRDAMKIVPPTCAKKWVFTAPAIDWDSLDEFPFSQFDMRIIHSKKDDVLRLAYRFSPGNWFSPALGYAGPKTPMIDAEVIDMTNLVQSHSGHRKVDEFYQYLL